MPYSFYKIMHLTAIIAVFLSLGAVLHHVMLGGQKEGSAKKLLGITHGVALLLILVSGFGLLAKLKLSVSGWVIAKLAIWVILGGATVIVYKMGQSKSKALFFVFILIGGIAAYLAQMKPF